MPRQHRYFAYILTNPACTALYVGVTNALLRRLGQHRDDAAGARITFAGRYNCIHLVYYEEYGWIHDAIARETSLKRWTRAQKIELIKSTNPDFRFLEEELDGRI